MNNQKFKHIIDEHLEIFKNISEEDWNYKSSENKWSKKEILGHLCDSAINNIRRFVVTQYKENVNIVYDQDFWVKAQNYQQINHEEIIQLWKFLNYQIANVVENIPTETLQKMVDVSKTEKHIVTLEFVINDYIPHMLHHLEGIKK